MAGSLRIRVVNPEADAIWTDLSQNPRIMHIGLINFWKVFCLFLSTHKRFRTCGNPCFVDQHFRGTARSVMHMPCPRHFYNGVRHAQLARPVSCYCCNGQCSICWNPLARYHARSCFHRYRSWIIDIVSQEKAADISEINSCTYHAFDLDAQ